MKDKLKRRLCFAASALVSAALISIASSSPAQADLTTDPSGIDSHLGDYNGWDQVFRDNFPTYVPLGSFPEAVSSKWGAYEEGWSDTSGNGTYSPHRTTYIQDGTLRVNMKYDSNTDEYLVSAPVPKHPQNMLGGKFRIRLQYGFTDGYTPATAYKVVPLLWPDSSPGHPEGDWDRGEIDWPETNITPNAYGAFGFSHKVNDPEQACGQTVSDARPGWHTWTVDWMPGAQGYVKFFKDSVLQFTCTGQYVPQEELHWIIQMETKLTGANPEPAPPTSARAWALIDWVEVYKPCPTCTA